MRIWIVPRNDLEAVEIINLLEASGELVVVSAQPWGASWDALEPVVVTKVERLLLAHPDSEVLGVELAGSPRFGGRNIDHHSYGSDNRLLEVGSIEQVAALLGYQLNRYQRLVVANDKSWIPGLVAAGASQGEIEAIRLADRCSQGVTPDQEAQAVRDLETAEWRGRKVRIICPHGSTSAHTDRLYGRFEEALTTAPDKWIYRGPRSRELYRIGQESGLGTARDWCGGSAEHGYCGFLAPREELQKLVLNFFWQD